METATQPRTLRQMRDELDLTVDQVAPLVAAELGRETYDPSSVTKAERDGIYDARVLNAYANVYNQPVAETLRAVGIPVKK